MPANYAVILRRSALLTAPVALLMIVLGAVLAAPRDCSAPRSGSRW